MFIYDNKNVLKKSWDRLSIQIKNNSLKIMKFYASTHSGGHWPGKWEVHLIAWDMQKIKILLAFLSRNLRCRLDMCAVPGVPCVKSNLHSWGCKIILSFKLYNIKILLNLVRRSSNFELLQLHYHKNRRLVSVLFHLNLSLTHTLRKNGKTYPAGGGVAL